MTWTKLALLAVTLGLTLLPPLALLDQQAAVSFERHAAYWCQAVLCMTWALALWRFMRGGRLAVALKQHYRLLALSISLAILFAALLPQDLKIISDEVHLLNVSLGMYQDQAPLQSTGGEFADEELNYLSTSFNRRPHLFPFLTHLAHHATGYRVENVFAVNLLAGCALFLGTGLIAGQLIGGTATYCAPLLLAAVPALGSNITSGSFDTANLACLAWTILLLLRWRERPDAGLWPLLILTYGLLCHLRYEAPIYALAALPVLWAVRRSPTHRADLISWYSALAPLLLLPRLWRQPLFNLGWELTGGPVGIFAGGTSGQQPSQPHRAGQHRPAHAQFPAGRRIRPRRNRFIFLSSATSESVFPGRIHRLRRLLAHRLQRNRRPLLHTRQFSLYLAALFHHEPGCSVLLASSRPQRDAQGRPNSHSPALGFGSPHLGPKPADDS